jgi:DNA-binding LacI/PurR family transcriptional regulator
VHNGDVEDGSAPTEPTDTEPTARSTRPISSGTRAGAVREPGTGTGARRPPTIEEVARLAGVGRGTASRVVNGSPQVSPATRAAVQQAVEALGYVPNRAARSLVTRRTDTVALVVSEPGDRVFGEPYFGAIVRGVGQRLTASPFQLLLTMAGTERDRAHLAAYLTEQHVDGVLLLSLHANDDLAARLDERGVPTVCGGAVVGSDPAVVVDADNRAGGAAAVDHLLGLGRRRLAVLTGPQDMSSGRDRLSGARAALTAAGLDHEGLVLAFGDYSEDSGERAMREVLASGLVPDAVLACSDLMAVGALRVLREAGLRVPDNVALMGFDDSAVCRHTDPALTSVHQPIEEMGRVMADLLLARIAGEPVPPRTVLPTRLVVRASA